VRILSLKCDRVGDRPRRCFVQVFRGGQSSMICNRYRLTPQQKQKLSAKANELRSIRELSDSQYLIANRLQELAVLLRVKRIQFTNTQLRINTNGSSPVLVRELAQQKEQVEDLLQLAEDWRNLLGLCREKPDLSELSPSLKVMLRSLGLKLHTDSATQIY
jgi:hypothetical protein